MSIEVGLDRAIDSLGGRVVVLGDAMLDEYVWGDSTRISPEAPVPVVHEKSRTGRAGGAANAAANIAALGGEPVLVSVIGSDEAGGSLRQLVATAGIRELLVSTESRPTTRKTRVIVGSHQVARIDSEDPAPVEDATADELLALASGQIATASALLISDYGKGVVTERVAQGAIEAARAAGIAVVVDPKGKDFARYRGASIVTPNESEAAGANIGPKSGLEEDVAFLRELLPGSDVLVTLGPRGMALFAASGERFDVAALSRHVFDVTGAGDTVAATLASALAGGVDTPTAARLANAAAAIVVGEVGIATVGRDGLRSAVTHSTSDPS